jgi:DNA-binding CsgD family transcriptional regulator
MKTDQVSFTERQRQVVALIAHGLSNEEIGGRLGISRSAVKGHCDLIRHKLGVTRRRLIPGAFAAETGENPLLHEVVPTSELVAA